MAERGELPEACSGCYSDVVVDARASIAHSVSRAVHYPETYRIGHFRPLMSFGGSRTYFDDHRLTADDRLFLNI